MKNIFLFPGQGAQTQGMAMDLYESSIAARKVIDDMTDICCEDIVALLRDTEPALLSRGDKSQLAITAASLAATAALKEKGIMPDACAGFSLGEFPALCVSGILTFEDTVHLVQKRGQIMQAVCDELSSAGESNESSNISGMAAVIGLPPEKIVELLAPYCDVTKSNAVFPTNLNSPKQTVVSGTSEGLSVCEKICSEAGARRVIRLKVAGPFHSPLMQKAAELFALELDKVTFNNPIVPCFSNVTGSLFSNGQEAKDNACNHIIMPVRWTDEEKAFAKMIDLSGEDWRLLESGPGKVLSGLWADSGYSEKAQSFPCGTWSQIEEL